MDVKEAIKKAIEIHKGKKVENGYTIAHESDELTHEFVEYDGDDAVCKDVDGNEKRFPAAEIFDINKVRDSATRIYHGLSENTIIVSM